MVIQQFLLKHAQSTFNKAQEAVPVATLQRKQRAATHTKRRCPNVGRSESVEQCQKFPSKLWLLFPRRQMRLHFSSCNDTAKLILDSRQKTNTYSS